MLFTTAFIGDAVKVLAPPPNVKLTTPDEFAENVNKKVPAVPGIVKVDGSGFATDKIGQEGPASYPERPNILVTNN